MIGDDLFHDRQAETGTVGFYGKARLKKPHLDIIGDAGPGVHHLQLHVVSGSSTLVKPYPSSTACGNGDGTPVRHGVHRIGYQVVEHVVHLFPVHPHSGEIRAQLQTQTDVRRQAALTRIGECSHDVVEIDL